MPNLFFYMNFFWLILFPLHYYFCGWALQDGGGSEGFELPSADGPTTKNTVYLASGDSPITHAFVQTGSELTYFRDSFHQDVYITAFNEKIAQESSGLPNPSERRSFKSIFLEELTNFGAGCVGVPVQRHISVFNPTDLSIELFAVTSSSSNFHVAFFEEKELEAQKTLFFTVYFLPAEHFARAKVTKALITVYTSVGIFQHRVIGSATSNIYRLRSHDLQIPLNASFSVPLNVYNPHKESMKVLDLFSNDPNVKIEQYEDVTEIPPFEMATLGETKILGNIERETTTFVVLTISLDDEKTTSKASDFQTIINSKLNGITEIEQQSRKKEEIFVPFRVKVVNRRSIFPTTEVIDFGLVQFGAEVKPQHFAVFSNLENTVEFDSIYVSESVNKAHGVYLQFDSSPPIPVRSGPRNQPVTPVSIASVYMDSTQMDKNRGVERFPADGSKKTEDNADFVIQNDESINERRGVIVAESRGGNYNISIPYRALLYSGSIFHDPEEISFHKDIKVTSRSVFLTNKFPFDVAILDVRFASDENDVLIGDSLRIELMEQPYVEIPSDETRLAFIVHYAQNSSHQKPITFSRTLEVHTNLSDSVVKIPVHVFSGELHWRVHSLDTGQLNFGAVRLNERRSIRLTVENPNPVPIRLLSPEAPKSLLFSKVEHRIGLVQPPNAPVEASDYGQQNLFLPDANLQHAKSCATDVLLPPNSNLQMEYTVSVGNEPVDDDVIYENLTLTLKTQFGFELSMPVTYGVIPKEHSSLISVSKIVFNDVFPNSFQAIPLTLHNSFPTAQEVLRLSIASGDPRFYVVPSDAEPFLIEKNATAQIAKVAFLDRGCNEKGAKTNANAMQQQSSHNGNVAPGGEQELCYAGISLATTDGQWFSYGLKLPQNLAEIDSYLYFKLRRLWNKLVEGGRDKLNTSLIVDTNTTRHFEVGVEANYVWPRLALSPVVHFPLTAVGNFSIVNLTIRNPSIHPVIVQILPLVIYPDADAFMELFRTEFPSPLTDLVEANETLMFSLRDTELFTLRKSSPVSQLREELEYVVGSALPRFTLSMLLRPGMRTMVRIGFLPVDYNLRSSVLVIRNNLTALEPVVLYGRGAHIGMEVENRTSRVKNPILFDILPTHLTECSNPRRLLHRLPTTLTVRRTLSVFNSGEVPFQITNISISARVHHISPCENFGFRVLNCHPFRLDPGDTTYLDIAYTPDFLMAVNDATLLLFMHMNATPWMFELSARVPPKLLSICHNALPRPPFERVMYHSCTLALVFCLICVVSCSYLEADRTVGYFFRAQFAFLNPTADGEIEVAPEVDIRHRSSSSRGLIENGGGSISRDQTPLIASTDSRNLSAKNKRQQRRRKQYVEAAQNAGIAEQWAARAANYVLGCVQPVWQMYNIWVRGNVFATDPFGGAQQNLYLRTLTTAQRRPRAAQKQQVPAPEGEDDGDQNDQDDLATASPENQSNGVEPPATGEEMQLRATPALRQRHITRSQQQQQPPRKKSPAVAISADDAPTGQEKRASVASSSSSSTTTLSNLPLPPNSSGKKKTVPAPGTEKRPQQQPAELETPSNNNKIKGTKQQRVVEASAHSAFDPIVAAPKTKGSPASSILKKPIALKPGAGVGKSTTSVEKPPELLAEIPKTITKTTTQKSRESAAVGKHLVEPLTSQKPPLNVDPEHSSLEATKSLEDKQRKQEAFVRKMQSQAVYQLPTVDLTAAPTISSKIPNLSSAEPSPLYDFLNPHQHSQQRLPPQQQQHLAPLTTFQFPPVVPHRHVAPGNFDFDDQRSVVSEMSATPEWDDEPLDMMEQQFGGNVDAAMEELFQKTNTMANQMEAIDRGKFLAPTSEKKSKTLRPNSGKYSPTPNLIRSSPLAIGSERSQKTTLLGVNPEKELVEKLQAANPIRQNLPAETQKMIAQLTSEFESRVTQLLAASSSSTASGKIDSQKADPFFTGLENVLSGISQEKGGPTLSKQKLVEKKPPEQDLRELLRMPSDLRIGADESMRKAKKPNKLGLLSPDEPIRASPGFIASLWDREDRRNQNIPNFAVEFGGEGLAGQSLKTPENEPIWSQFGKQFGGEELLPPSHQELLFSSSQKTPTNKSASDFDSLFYADDPTWRPILEITPPQQQNDEEVENEEDEEKKKKY